MKEDITELRGRMMMLETLFATALAHIARLTDQPHIFVQGVMENVEQTLVEQHRMTKGIEQRAVEYARASFGALTPAMLAHITKIAPPSGSA